MHENKKLQHKKINLDKIIKCEVNKNIKKMEKMNKYKNVY